MTTATPLGKRLARRIVDRNPFLLVSALLVLGGGYLVAGTNMKGAVDTWRLLGLFTFVQCYELALIGAAGFVDRFVGVRDPAARRDAATLLALAVLFLGDVSFTNSLFPGNAVTGIEVGVAREDLVAPILTALLAIGLGPLKLWLAGRAGRIHWPRAVYAFLVPALVLIHGGPVFVLLRGEESCAAGAIDALWWLVALLPLALAWASAGDAACGVFENLSRRHVVLALGAALGAASVGHIVASGWAHHVTFLASHPAPLLLGLGVALPRLVSSEWRPRAASWALAPISIGVGLACFAPESQRLELGPASLTTLRAVLLLAAVILADLARIAARPRILYAAGAVAFLAVLGGTPAEIDDGLLNPPALAVGVMLTAAGILTVKRADHAVAALAGLAAAYGLAGGLTGLSAKGTGGTAFVLLAVSLVSFHQLVLAHRQSSAAWLHLRSSLAWTTLGTALASALVRGPSAEDGYVLALVALGVVVRAASIRVSPALLAATLLGLGTARVRHHLPTERTGIGALALVSGVGFLGIGLAVSIARQRLSAWIEPIETHPSPW